MALIGFLPDMVFAKTLTSLPLEQQKPIAVIDYGGGNLGSLLRALERLQLPYFRVDGKNGNVPGLENPILLPGVGAFGALMKALEGRGLVAPLKQAIANGVPFLGVCVGLQVLLESSAESPGVAGLGVIPGKVVPFDRTKVKVPQIGWNRVDATQENTPYPAEGYVYFVNSYVAQPAQPAHILYEGQYGEPFCAAIRHEHVTAFQFHPEKSDVFGHELIRQWWLESIETLAKREASCPA